MVFKVPSLLNWIIYWCIWTVVACFFTIQIYVDSIYSGQDPGWAQSLVNALIQWYITGFLGLGVIPLVRRFYFRQEYWLRRAIFHLFAAFIFAALKVSLESAITPLPPIQTDIQPASMIPFNLAYLSYWAIVGVIHGRDYYQKYRERKLRASQLEALLARAELQVLRMQLQPHFLFNALHTISTLMHEDVEAADDMLTKLGDLLRMSLETRRSQEVPLRSEIEFLRVYLDLQKIRFRDRFDFHLDVASELNSALVPSFLLQPLVENAVIHGISQMDRMGVIEVCASQEDRMLHIKIEDNGSGINSNSRPPGVGLSNTRRRLQQLYGQQHKFDIRTKNGGGVAIDLVLPYKPEQERDQEDYQIDD